MYIAIYVCAIVLAVAMIVLFFVLRNKKDKKHLNDYKNSKVENTDRIMKEADLPQNLEKVQEIHKVEITKEAPPKIDATFEDFSLDGNKNATSKSGKKAEVRIQDNNQFLSSVDDEDENEEMQINDDDDDDFFDEKFAEYEKFLRENLSSEEDDDDLEDDTSVIDFDTVDDSDDLDALADFDLDSLKGKSDEEIAELIKNLPPKAQELLMIDILGKKNFDDKED